jgi:hypothetical protein
MEIRTCDNYTNLLDPDQEAGIQRAISGSTQAADRYYHLINGGVREIRQLFDERELGLLLDLSCGTLYIPAMFTAFHMEVEDAEDLYFEKWQVNRESLIGKCKSLSTVQAAGLIECIEYFWFRVQQNGPTGNADLIDRFIALDYQDWLGYMQQKYI